MERWKGRVALVTGASTGIGAAIAVAFANHGMTVVGCSRHPDEIKKLNEDLEETEDVGTIVALKCDVSKPEDIKKLFERVESEHGGADVLINNAGIAIAAPILSGKTEDWRQMQNVNVLGLVLCTQAAVASMRARGVDDGHIVNICSMSGHRVVQNAATHFYSATKCAVRAITEATRMELREAKTNIRVSEISPSITQTRFFPKLMGGKPAKKMYKSMQYLQSEDIASTVVHMLSAPPHVQISDVLMRCTEQTS